MTAETDPNPNIVNPDRRTALPAEDDAATRALLHELLEIKADVALLKARRDPWPWVAIAAVWTAVVALTAVLALMLPAAVWTGTDRNAGWLVLAAIVGASYASRTMSTAP